MSHWAKTALAEWRGYREPTDPEARTSLLGSVLGKLMPQLGLGQAMDEQAVRKSWVLLVGDFIATQSAPDRIRGGVLYVKVHQPSVRFELERMWKAEITRKLSEEFGSDKIREVKFFS